MLSILRIRNEFQPNFFKKAFTFCYMLLFGNLLSLGIPLSAYAAGESYIYDGIEIGPAVRYFEQFILTTNKPIQLYHWNDHGDLGDGDEAQATTLKMADYFWRSFGDSRATGMMGNGFYLAMDPFITWQYGGSPYVPFDPATQSTWSFQLIQVRLPLGFRILDLSANPMKGSAFAAASAAPLLTEADRIFNQFKCPLISYGNRLYSYFQRGAGGVPDQCQRLLKKIARNILQIDALIYDYSRTPLQSIGEIKHLFFQVQFYNPPCQAS